MRPKSIFVSISAAVAIMHATFVLARAWDSFGTVSEGYSETYSESSSWSYDGDSSSSSSYYDYDYHGSNSRSKRWDERTLFEKVLLGLFLAIPVGFAGYAAVLIITLEINRCRERIREAERARLARLQKIEHLSNSVEIIDDPAAPRHEQHRPIFYSGGLIQSQGVPNDPVFCVAAHENLVLFRKVEVYCWREDISKRTERRGN